MRACGLIICDTVRGLVTAEAADDTAVSVNTIRVSGRPRVEALCCTGRRQVSPPAAGPSDSEPHPRNIFLVTPSQLPVDEDTSLFRVKEKDRCKTRSSTPICSKIDKNHVELRHIGYFSVSRGVHHHDAQQAEGGGCVSAVHLVDRSAAVPLLSARRHLPLQQLPVGLHLVCGRFHSRR